MSAERPTKSSRPRRSPAGVERQRDAERSRGRLLEAALDEFSAHGLAGTRVQDIAARAGVNAQLITYYFGGKDGLYHALQQQWLSREAGFARPELPLEQLVTAYLDATLQDPRGARLLLWAGLDDNGTDHQRPAADADSHDVADLERRQAAGEIAPDLDPAIFQLALMGAILAPLALPQICRQLTGLQATDPEFKRRFCEQLARIVRHLAA